MANDSPQRPDQEVIQWLLAGDPALRRALRDGYGQTVLGTGGCASMHAI